MGSVSADVTDAGPVLADLGDAGPVSADLMYIGPAFTDYIHYIGQLSADVLHFVGRNQLICYIRPVSVDCIKWCGVAFVFILYRAIMS